MFNTQSTAAAVIVVLASFTSFGVEAQLSALETQPYKAVARPDIKTTDQLWGEFFKLPDGFNQYDNTDFGEKGLTFTYECSNPDLLKVTNCGFNPDPEVRYRKNNITWYVEPMKFGEATLTVTAHYNGEEVTATREFIIGDVPSPIFTPSKPNIYNLGGVHNGKPKTVTTYMSTFFTMPDGWRDPQIWEEYGITWGVDVDNKDLVSGIKTSVDGSYAKIEITVEPITAEATLTAWVERGGVRAESPFHFESYAAKAVDDELYVLLADNQEVDVDVLSNDKYMTGKTVELAIVGAPRYGKVETKNILDKWGRESLGLSFKLEKAEGIEAWCSDDFTYRLTIKEEDGTEIESSVATVRTVLRPNPAISKIHEFVAAPGQFTNNLYNAKALIGSGGSSGSSSVPATTGMVSLGTFGGYIVFGFDSPIYNDPRNPYGVDFTIGGNAFKAAQHGYWSEPGAVMVMRDDNHNGEPDDTWYELAGSDYWFKTTRHNITRTFYDPGYASRYPVYFTTSDGETGALPTNQFHSQSYFPDKYCYPDANIVDGKLTLGGTLIQGTYDRRTPNYIETYRPFAFGYCDNHATNGDISIPKNPYYAETAADGTVIEPTDGFDISWAVDKDGNYVELDHIDFVKVYNAIDENCGWLGESSTEVAGFSMTRPDFNQEAPGDYYLNYANVTQLMVELGKTCEYEGFAFHNGRPMFDAKATWSVEDPEIGTIDENGVFTAKKIGNTKIHFSATDLAADDVFEVEVVTLNGVVICPEGHAADINEINMLVGDHQWLNAESTVEGGSTVLGSKADRYIYDTYTWISSYPEVIEIDNWGSLTAYKLGSVTLTVTSNSNPSLTASINVNVIETPEVKRVCNYLVVEDQNLSQEELNARNFTCREIFDASYRSERVTNYKTVDMKIAAVEPAEYADLFYISNNRLLNRLEKGDWREYLLTIEGTLDGVTTTYKVPFLHTSGYNTIMPPTINENAEIIVDTATRLGTLDLATVFIPGGYEGLYKTEYRLASSNEFPEDAKVEIADGILSFSYDGEVMPYVKTIVVEGRVMRNSQKVAAATPQSPQWQPVIVTVKTGTVTGVEEISSEALVLYPNPAVYAFTINVEEPAQVRIYTIGGALVADTVLNPGESVDVSALPEGIYMVVAGGRTFRLVKK